MKRKEHFTEFFKNLTKKTTAITAAGALAVAGVFAGSLFVAGKAAPSNIKAVQGLLNCQYVGSGYYCDIPNYTYFGGGQPATQRLFLSMSDFARANGSITTTWTARHWMGGMEYESDYECANTSYTSAVYGYVPGGYVTGPTVSGFGYPHTSSGWYDTGPTDSYCDISFGSRPWSTQTGANAEWEKSTFGSYGMGIGPSTRFCGGCPKDAHWDYRGACVDGKGNYVAMGNASCHVIGTPHLIFRRGSHYNPRQSSYTSTEKCNGTSYCGSGENPNQDTSNGGTTISPGTTFPTLDIKGVKDIDLNDQYIDTTNASTYAFDLEALGENSGQNIVPVRLTGVAGLPAGISYNVYSTRSDSRNANVVFSGKVAQPGVYTVTVNYQRLLDTKKYTKTFKYHVKDTTAPNITEIPDKVLKTESTVTPGKHNVNIPFSVTDNSGVYDVEKVEGLPEGLTWSKSGIQGNIAAEEVNKDFNIKVTATDTLIEGHPTHDLNKSTETFKISVKDGTEPTVSATSFAGVTKRLEELGGGEPVNPSRKIVANMGSADNSGEQPKLTFSRPLPAGLEYVPESDSIEGILEPSTIVEPNYNLNITATDADGNSQTYPATFSITDGTEPTFSVSDQTAKTRDNFSYSIPNVADNSGVRPTGEIDLTPDGLTWNGNTWVLAGRILDSLAAGTGLFTINVTGTDGSGNVSNPKQFSLRIIDTVPPVIDDIEKNPDGVTPKVVDGQYVLSDDSTTTEENYSRQITATDNSNNPLKYAATGLPEGITINEDTGLISGKTAEPGTYVVSVTATDPTGNTSIGAKYTLTVIDKTPPTIIPPTEFTFDTTNPGEFTIKVTDNDHHAPVLEWVISPDSLNDENTAISATFSTDNTEDPSYPRSVVSGTTRFITPYDRVLEIKATDKAGNTSVSKVPLHVLDTTPPVAPTEGDGDTFVCEAGIDCTGDLNPTDNDGTEPSTTVDNPSQLPDKLTINEDGTFDGLPNDVGEYDIDVTYTDKAGNETKGVVHVTVQDTTPPTAEVDGNDPEGSNLEYTFELQKEIDPIVIAPADNSEKDVTFKYENLPPGLEGDDDGNITGTPTEVGDFETTVTITDESGNELEVRITIHVVDTTPPEIVPPANCEQTGDGSVSCTAEAGDDSSWTPESKKDDGGDVTCSTTSTLPPGMTLDEETCEIAGKSETPGEYPVDVDFADPSGNITTIHYDIIIKDTTPPEVSLENDGHLRIPACHVPKTVIPVLATAKDNSDSTIIYNGLANFGNMEWSQSQMTFSGVLPNNIKPGDSGVLTLKAFDASQNVTEKTIPVTFTKCDTEHDLITLVNAPSGGSPLDRVAAPNGNNGDVPTLAKTGVTVSWILLLTALSLAGAMATLKIRRNLRAKL